MRTGASDPGPRKPPNADAGLSRLTLQPSESSGKQSVVDPDVDGSRGETSVGRLVKQLRQGLFGVLFVMAKDVSEGPRKVALLVLLVDFFQVGAA